MVYLGCDPRRKELGSGESETGQGKIKKRAHGVIATVSNWGSVPWGKLVEHISLVPPDNRHLSSDCCPPQAVVCS